jgi:hypothetical protein
MAYEPPHMPERDEILKRALELFHVANPQLPTITPEEDELKEGSYWNRARDELMSGIHAALEEYLHYLETEADRAREELGIEKPLPTSEHLTELEDKLSTLEQRYKIAKERLAETEEELRKVREAKPPTPPVAAPTPPPTPPSAPAALSDEEVRYLWEEFLFTLSNAKVPNPELYRSRFDREVKRDKTYMDNATRLRRLAGQIISEAAKPALIPAPIEAIPIRVAIAEKRVRNIVTRYCPLDNKQFLLDLDLKDRVSEDTASVRGAGRVRQNKPVLGFPEMFYHLCPDHRFEKYGYRDIYDALAYLLAEGRRSDYKKVKVTKDTLRAIGLDEADLEEIQALEVRYRVS